MSVASVLERSGNVRDMRELDPVGKVELWDRVTFSPKSKYYEFNVFTLIAFPEIIEILPSSELELAKNSSTRSHMRDDLKVRLTNEARKRILFRNLKENSDNSKLYNDSLSFINKYRNKNIKIPRDIENVRNLLNISIIFPQLELSGLVESYYLENPNLLNEILDDDFDFGRTSQFCVESLILIKLMTPHLLSGINVKKSHTYMSFEEKISNFSNSEFYFFNHAAYLKILASEGIEKTDTDIKLIMPNFINLGSPRQLPEIGRFEA